MKLALCLLLFMIPVCAQRRDLVVESSQRLALVVGNAAYPKSPLRNPLNDAKAVAGALGDLGFQTETALDLPLRALEATVNRFVARVRAGDTVVFYYAGHGIQLEGENYLVPTDFDAKDEADAKYVSYSASRVQERIEKAGARVIVVILDACRNNPFQATRSAGGGLAAMGSGKGTLIAFATGPGKTADDNPRGANGLFTTHLISTLREPGLSLDQVFSRVREKVYRESDGRQVPWTVSSVIGDVFLRGGTPAPAPVAAVVNPLSRKTEAPVEPVAGDLLRDGNQALERGDFQDAIAKAQSLLRTNANHKEGLLLLTSGYYRTQDWVPFVSTARQALAAGNTIQFLMGHHHTLTGAHPAVVAISKEKISYKSLGGTCNQPPFEYPVASLTSAQVVSARQGEVFLNVKVLDEKNKVKNLNFADPDSTIAQDENGLPKVVSPPKAAAQLQAVGAVLMNAIR
ncbi:MAG: caspase family protein [Acidobacteria bacterium]|nr:caspase family protein [Acidobacteriota bacterium]